MVKAKVVLEEMGVGKNGAKTQVGKKYSPARPRVKL